MSTELPNPDFKPEPEDLAELAITRKFDPVMADRILYVMHLHRCSYADVLNGVQKSVSKFNAEAERSRG